MQKKSKLWQLMAFGLAILPAALTGILIIQYNVSVPFLDRWEVAKYIIKSYSHQDISLSELFAQHNESRSLLKNFAKATKIKAYSMSGWQKYFQASKLPKGWLKINAWAYDTNSGKAFKIGGTVMLENN